MTRNLGSLLIVALSMLAAEFAAADVERVTLEPIRHQKAALVIAGTSGETSYAPAELEAMGASRMVTITPWREEPTTFEGVLLSELLTENGLADVAAIRVIAENDYAVVIPREIWTNWPMLVATRVNGKAHSRRERGPIQFVLPMSDSAEVGEGEYVNHWVWMAARIEAAE